ncbi:MAG: tetratricopeptide repeat protein [Deltaproteobacteria bacterium]|nr:MAG: tetratricopeptide repeat protein [Deltaproteobacteria bacterium]
MERTTTNILLAELYSASAYIDRIFHALLHVTNLAHGQQCRRLGKEMAFDLRSFLQDEILRTKFENEEEVSDDLREVRKDTQNAKSLLESTLKIGFNSEVMVDTTVKFINLLYSYAHEFHDYIEKNADLEIQYPRVNLIEIHYEHDDSLEEHLSSYQDEDWEEDESVPSFFLNKQAVMDIISSNASCVTNLENQRNKKYESLIHEGHENVFKKDLDKAMESFTKALNYKETAEVLTLLAWVHSMGQNYEKAKSLCLKAIQKDPDYGPPYNDLGTYLLSQGEIDESLKWFSLAKKAVNYQNREYPYINSGRAWMSKKNFEKALDEFSKALTLAPFHEELHQTVERLKKTLRRAGESHSPEPTPLS